MNKHQIDWILLIVAVVMFVIVPVAVYLTGFAGWFILLIPAFYIIMTVVTIWRRGR